jgi:hypothetical protein
MESARVAAGGGAIQKRQTPATVIAGAWTCPAALAAAAGKGGTAYSAEFNSLNLP